MQAVTKQLISAELRQRFSKATNVLVLSGAGVSAESGVPTFRGGGDSAVWKGMPFSVISSAGIVKGVLLANWGWSRLPPWSSAFLKAKHAEETYRSLPKPD